MDLDKYKKEMDDIHYTKKGKENLFENTKIIAKEKQQSTSEFKKVRSYRKYAIAATLIVASSVTVLATDTLQNIVEIFSPILGGNSAQTEIINEIGRPINSSDTENNITITADAIIGDETTAFIVYTLENSDGTTFELPTGVEVSDLHFSNDLIYGSKIELAEFGGLSQTLSIQENPNDPNSLQIIESLTSSKPLILGQNVTATFSNLSYENNILVNATWEVDYNLDYGDASKTIPVNETFTKDNIIYEIDNVVVSPISFRANYTVHAVPDEKSFSSTEIGNSGEETSSTIFTEDLEIKSPSGEFVDTEFIDNINIAVTKNNGEEIKIKTEGASTGPSTDSDEYTFVTKYLVFDDIVPLDEIASIVVDGIKIDLK